MFLEPQLNSYPHKPQSGWIEVVCGSMFSGKTEELIRRVNRAVIAQQKIQIFKPGIDNRYHESDVVSHNKNKVVSIPVNSAKEVLSHCQDCDVIAIDEAQFFDAEIVSVCIRLANRGKRVIVCGLDMDFEGKPFGPMPELMSIAEFVTKLHAICAQCGDVASYSYRLVDSQDKVLLGETSSYEARCRKCFYEKKIQEEKDHEAFMVQLGKRKTEN
ncbi:thymidine kinase [Flexithrix dorotheae]|uniref:thymidine kinase n=1 Tax=Flexithrix dorotheae TaxID=70993 RepID=UPI000362AFCA|nr:thymidine kinase [Flexithrix dorotheae]